MKRVLNIVLVCLACTPFAHGQSSPECDVFQKLVKITYDFKPSKLDGPTLGKKSADMDRVWGAVTTHPTEMLPCLRRALADPAVDSWFLFDGSMLLVQIDPSAESRKVQVRGLNTVDLDDVNLQTWVAAVAARGAEGLDLSEAGAHWLSYADAEYPVPEHATSVDTTMGALFIYGSMDESFATPALRKIATDTNHPRRDVALALLIRQATPEALSALTQLNALGKPELLQPRSQPKTNREEFNKAFESAVKDDWAPLQALMDKVGDCEKDVVAVLKPEDLPLLRQVRRKIISTANPHAVDYYDTFTQILLTLISK